MIFNVRSVKAFIYREPVDLRKGHDGLSSIVIHEITENLLSGAIFLFVNKRKNACKAIVFDGTGLVLIHKKLEQGTFMSFASLEEVEEVTASELALIFEGSRITLPLSPKEFKL